VGPPGRCAIGGRSAPSCGHAPAPRTVELPAPQGRKRRVGLIQRKGTMAVRTGTCGASARNSSPSRRVRLATEFHAALAHRIFVRKPGISLMWMPAQITAPPLAHRAQRLRHQGADGAKMMAASRASRRRCGGNRRPDRAESERENADFPYRPGGCRHRWPGPGNAPPARRCALLRQIRKCPGAVHRSPMTRARSRSAPAHNSGAAARSVITRSGIAKTVTLARRGVFGIAPSIW